MPDRDWHRHVAYIGLASVVVAVIVAPILVTAQDQWRDRQKYEQHTQAAYEEAGRSFSLLSKEDQSASTDARERAREDREKSDLDAQWATATWTQDQFIVGLVGLFATVGALAFAYLAWQATKAGVAVTRDIGQKQVRAYLSLGAGRVMHTDLGVGEDAIPHLRFRFRVRNAGQSPARELRLRVECTIDVPGFRHIERWVSIGISPVAAGGREWADVYINYNNGLEEPLIGLPDMLDVTMATLGVIARIDGFDVFDRPLDPATCAYSFRVHSFNTDHWYPMERITSQMLADRDADAIEEV